MSSGRHFPIQSFVWSVVLVAVAAVSVYLGYELVIVPRRAMQDEIRKQKETIVTLEQEKQRLETYLKILKHVDRRARVEVLHRPGTNRGIYKPRSGSPRQTPRANRLVSREI